MSQVFQLAYIGIESADRPALDRWVGDVVGLMPGSPLRPGASAWRLDEKACRIEVSDGPANDVVHVGYEYPDHDALAGAVARLSDLGFAPEPGEPDRCQQRRVSELYSVMSPWDTVVELVTGFADADEPVHTPRHPGGFLTGDYGLGHAVFFLPLGQLERGRQFVTEGLGMILTDYIEVDGDSRRAEFFHSNGRHHSTALVGVQQVPRRLHHIMVETASVDNVGVAFDRALVAGLPIPRSLGRHDNDEMFSFYARTPAGFDIEVGTGGVSVDENWVVQRYQRGSTWGHQPYHAGASR